MSRNRLVRLVLALACFLLVLPVCGGGGGGGGGFADCFPPSDDTATLGTRQYRAIAGVSMGGYGALNLGTKHQDMFSMIGSMGGPVDLLQLLLDIRDDNLDVKTPAMRTGLDDFTFDILPMYPDRGTRIVFTKDLVLAFGNPLLHHGTLATNVFLASTSQPAAIRRDDQWGLTGVFNLVPDFADGGDDDEDGLRQTTETVPDETGEPILVAGGSLENVLGVTTGIMDVGGRSLADTDTDGVFDVGDGIVVNLWEPFTDVNGNGIWDTGEPFQNVGLDGIGSTGDFGEGTPAQWDMDPDVQTWLDEDPTTRLMSMSPAEIQSQRIYMDAGDTDELNFLLHHENAIDAIEAAGGVTFDRIFDADDDYCNPANFPDIDEPYTFLTYEGGHVGFDTDELEDQLRDVDVDVCGSTAIWQRLVHLLSAADAAFPDGEDAIGGGDTLTCAIPSPALALPGGAAPERTVVIYRPPAYFTTNEPLPILYFLGGHGQKPEDYERINLLMDTLVNLQLIQNMIMVFLPGEGGVEGSFYVNHAVPESQVPDVPVPVADTSGNYEDSIFDDLIPHVERNVLRGRVR